MRATVAPMRVPSIRHALWFLKRSITPPRGMISCSPEKLSQFSGR